MYLVQKFFNLIFFLGMISVNIMTIPGVGPLKPIQNISKIFETSISPPDWTFSIWGLIYFGLLLFSCFQFCSSFNFDQYINKISCYFIFTCILNASWLIVFSLGNKYSILISLFIILALMSMLTLIEIKGKFFKVDNKYKIVFLDIPFSIYLGWIYFATLANIATCFKAWGIYNGEVLFYSMTITGLVVNIFNLFCNNNYVTMLVFLYVITSLFIKYSDNKNYYPILIVTGGASVLFIVIKILINSYKSRKKKKLNFYSNLDEQAV